MAPIALLGIVFSLSVRPPFPEEELVELNGDWKFTNTEMRSWASPEIETSKWKSLTLPVAMPRTGAVGEVWLRREFELARVPNDNLAIVLGSIRGGFELSVNGQSLGFHEAFRIIAFPDIGGTRAWTVPNSLLRVGKNVVGLHFFDSNAILDARNFGGPAKIVMPWYARTQGVNRFLQIGVVLGFGLLAPILFGLRAVAETIKAKRLYGAAAFGAATCSFYSATTPGFVLIPFDLSAAQFTIIASWATVGIAIGLIEFFEEHFRRDVSVFRKANRYIGAAFTVFIIINTDIAYKIYCLYLFAPIAYLVFLSVRELRKPTLVNVSILAGMLGLATSAVMALLNTLGVVFTPHFFVYALAWLASMMALIVLEDVTRRTHEKARLLAELGRKAIAAEAATKAKSQFLAAMSHELRTPLNGVSGMADIALNGPLTVDQRDALLTIRASADWLINTVEEVLEFAKAEGGKIVMQDGPWNPRELIAEIARVLSPAAQQKKLELTVEIAKNVPEVVRGDGFHVRQVISHLASNGIKFTHTGSVTLRVFSPAIGRLAFSIGDSGIGISPIDHQRIFEAFTQVDAGTARRFDGAGLGLTLARELVGRMGSELKVTSALGKGSTFSFELNAPLVQAPPKSSSELTPMPAPGTPPLCSVLIAEDNPVNAKVLVRLLERLGVQSEVVVNGVLACQRAGEKRFDIIFMDINMPEMDGLEATRKLRTEGHTVPIIAVTARSSSDEEQECLGAGMNDFLAKPVNAALLEKSVHKALGGVPRERPTVP